MAQPSPVWNLRSVRRNSGLHLVVGWANANMFAKAAKSDRLQGRGAEDLGPELRRLCERTQEETAARTRDALHF